MPTIRPSIHNWPLAGVGGYLAFEWKTTGRFQPTTQLERLHIEQWDIEHDYENLELFMSGGRGSAQNRLVADRFRVNVILDLDLSRVPLNNPSDTSSGQPFYDGRLRGSEGGHYAISMRLQCGDPSFLYSRGRTIATEVGGQFQGVFYACSELRLEKVRTINSARGDDNVTCVVRLAGGAPLQRFFNGQYVGAGTLFLEEDDLPRD